MTDYDSLDQPYIDLPRVYEDYTMEDLIELLKALEALTLAAREYELKVEPILVGYSWDERFQSGQLVVGLYHKRPLGNASIQVLAEIMLRADLDDENLHHLEAKLHRDYPGIYGFGLDTHSSMILAGIWRKQLVS